MISQMSNLKTQSYNSNLKSNIRYRAYQLSLVVIQLVNSFPEKRAFWVIGDQLLKASTSIGANLIEAKASSSRKDFIRFYEISLKSANETKYWLCLLRDSKLMQPNKLDLLITEINEISKMIGSSILTLKGKRV